MNHHAPTTTFDDAQSVPQRMATVMIEQLANGGCTRETLLAADFSATDIDLHAAEARRLANNMFQRVEATIRYDRAARVREAGEAILGLMPTVQVVVNTLLAANFPKHELDDILNDAQRHAGDAFAPAGKDAMRRVVGEARPSATLQTPRAVGLGQSVAQLNAKTWTLTFVFNGSARNVELRAPNRDTAELMLAAICETGRIETLPVAPVEGN